jgi:hypothetical protein
MSRCVRPAPPAPRTSSAPLVAPLVENTHPVATLEPRVNDPFEAIVISCPELWDKVDPVNDPPLPTVNDTSLSAWTTDVGLAWRFVRAGSSKTDPSAR